MNRKLRSWESLRPVFGQRVSATSPSGVACPECGKELFVRNDIVLTVFPPMRQYICKECGFVGASWKVMES